MQSWEYLHVETGWFGSGNSQLSVRLVNGQELKDWKKTPLHIFFTQLGIDSWEMTGVINVAGVYGQHLFFKRPATFHPHRPHDSSHELQRQRGLHPFVAVLPLSLIAFASGD